MEETKNDSQTFELISSSNTKDALSLIYTKDIRPLIDLIDKLRRFGIQKDVELPNVVVVGDQSSGKSSIIEALSGVQLPRGKGIVTRCPLELQLKRVYNMKWKAKISYCDQNSEHQEICIDNPEDVEVVVRRAQEAICGSGKCVSPELITLRVESPDESAPDLTLIDLPGIARIAVDGQPEDICEVIKSIIMKYVASDRTVILCVISANLEVAVNESLGIAKLVDPQGERTIGVITKPDAAEESQKEDILCLLNNNKIKLKKGFTMVKCRSQADLDVEMPLKDSLNEEERFFKVDTILSEANQSQLGIMNLAKKISVELVTIIKKSLPELKLQIEDSLRQTYKFLEDLGGAVPESIIDKRAYLTNMIWKINSDLKECLDHGKSSYTMDNHFYIWRSHFSKFLTSMEDKTRKALKSNLRVENFMNIVKVNRGPELNGFLDFGVFKKLISDHIETYEDCAVLLSLDLRKNIQLSLEKTILQKCDHLPEVAADLKEIICEEVLKAQKVADNKINFIFKQESIIFTMDVIFNKEMDNFMQKKIETIQGTKKSVYDEFKPPLLEYENGRVREANLEEMHDILRVYLNIVNHRLSDNIPMAVMQVMLVELRINIEKRFIEICTAEGMVDKVNENETLVARRKLFKDRIERLEKANALISRF